MIHRYLNLRGKWWKQDDVAKDVLTSCADEAASEAATETEVSAQMANDAGKRKQRLADRLDSYFDKRDRRMVERLGDVAKGTSESLSGSDKLGSKDAKTVEEVERIRL